MERSGRQMDPGSNPASTPDLGQCWAPPMLAVISAVKWGGWFLQLLTGPLFVCILRPLWPLPLSFMPMTTEKGAEYALFGETATPRLGC